jgi:1-acyl-sn-glycerol-3-phosphate acyltransferase
MDGKGESLPQLRRKIARFTLFLACVLMGLWRHRAVRKQASRADAAEWLHTTCARSLGIIGVDVDVEGTPPRSGLLVSNHCSYLDIPVLSSALSCVFVSKAEVEQWPVIGRYARWAGCVFVRRHDRADAARANLSIRDALDEGVPVVLFPEGTTTDGTHVLRFHSTMLQPAIDGAVPITPCAIRYELEDGDPAHEACWWGDMTFFPHLWNLLGKKSIRARVVFGTPIAPEAGRKQLSAVLHAEVLNLHTPSAEVVWQR